MQRKVKENSKNFKVSYSHLCMLLDAFLRIFHPDSVSVDIEDCFLIL